MNSMNVNANGNKNINHLNPFLMNINDLNNGNSMMNFLNNSNIMMNSNNMRMTSAMN